MSAWPHCPCERPQAGRGLRRKVVVTMLSRSAQLTGRMTDIGAQPRMFAFIHALPHLVGGTKLTSTMNHGTCGTKQNYLRSQTESPRFLYSPPLVPTRCFHNLISRVSTISK
jgi:hypothetical protein